MLEFLLCRTFSLACCLLRCLHTVSLPGQASQQQQQQLWVMQLPIVFLALLLCPLSHSPTACCTRVICLPPCLAAAAAAAVEDAVPLAAAAELEGDASEPRYCICKGVSYGDMVCCDNEECPIEWFHFPCVGLKEQPKGKWYCPDCSTAMQQQHHGHGHGHGHHGHAHGHGHGHAHHAAAAAAAHRHSHQGKAGGGSKAGR
jgi:hypothetical protein